MADWFFPPFIEPYVVVFKSLQSNQEATELLENVRKNKEELQTQLEKLQVQ